MPRPPSLSAWSSIAAIASISSAVAARVVSVMAPARSVLWPTSRPTLTLGGEASSARR